MLALLAMKPSTEVQREWLIDALWPDSDPDQGAYNLRRTLSDLRSALGQADAYVTSPTFHSLRLETGAHVTVDLARFAALCRHDDPDSLREAVDLYRGPLLEGWNEEWVAAARNERQQDYTRALDRLAAEAESRDDWSEAAFWLKRLIAADPFDERAHRRLMESFSRAGNYAAATLVYRELRSMLRGELNVEPAADTISLFETLQRESRSASKPNEDGTSPARRTPPPVRRSALPVQLTSLIGRDEETKTAKELLKKTRLLTLTGTGGCGKTRLALRVAAEVESIYPDGVQWLEYAAVTREDSVWRVVADGIGVREQADCPLEDTVCNALGSRRGLLVLDNCEHLVVALSRMASHLLRRCPDLRLLATSREPLNVSGEAAWRVPSLATPQHGGTLLRGMSDGKLTAVSVLSYESVLLFVERAISADGSFAVTDGNAADVAHICSRLDGIPLAIELAASRTSTLTAGQIATRLNNLFGVLNWGRSDHLPRQQTLRALIDWSHDLLTDLERVLFRRLSIFAGGWTLDAANGVMAGLADSEDAPDSATVSALFPTLDSSEVDELHSRLVDKSLVVFESGPDGHGRYRMLEPIRQYARERMLEAGEEAALSASHARWFARQTCDVSERLGGPDQARCLLELDVEQENLRAALEATIRTEQGLQMANSLWRYWYVRGHMREGSEWLRVGLEHNNGAGVTTRALAQLRSGIFAWSQDRVAEAERLFVSSLDAFRQVGDDPGTAYALHSLGMIAHGKHDYREACRYYGESVGLFERMDNKRSIAGTLLNIGAALHSLGDLHGSREKHEESLRIRRELGDLGGISSTLGGLGRVFVELGDLTSARKCFAESVQLKLELSDPFGLTQTMFGIAFLACIGGNYRGAVGLLGCMENMRAQMGGGPALSADPGLVEQMRIARESLGSDDYERLWSEGQLLEPETAIREVLVAL